MLIARQVNSSTQSVYWNLGKLLFEKQLERGYGNGVINQLSIELKNEFLDTGLFPLLRRNTWARWICIFLGLLILGSNPFFTYTPNVSAFPSVFFYSKTGPINPCHFLQRYLKKLFFGVIFPRLVQYAIGVGTMYRSVCNLVVRLTIVKKLKLYLKIVLSSTTGGFPKNRPGSSYLLGYGLKTTG